jgi:hypothetical protein
VSRGVVCYRLWPIAALATLVLYTSASAQATRDDATEIEGIVDGFVGSISSTGFSEFRGLAYPCYVVIPGEDGTMVAVQSAADLDAAGERVALRTRDLTIHYAGNAAVATFQFGPQDATAWASADMVLLRPAGFWVVQAIGLSPNKMQLASDGDALRSLRNDFLHAVTTEGLAPFDGLEFPFLFVNGRAGTLALVNSPEDLLGGGEAVALEARNVQVAYADVVAAITMNLLSADEELEGCDSAALLCVKTRLGWRVAAVVVGPSEVAGPDEGGGGGGDEGVGPAPH